MDTKHQFEEEVEAFARHYENSRAANSKRSTALEVAAAFLGKDSNAKSPAILDVPGFTAFLERHGITQPMFREALTAARAARKETERAEAERAVAEAANALVMKPRKVRKSPATMPARPEPAAPVARAEEGQLFLRDIPAGDL